MDKLQYVVPEVSYSGGYFTVNAATKPLRSLWEYSAAKSALIRRGEKLTQKRIFGFVYLRCKVVRTASIRVYFLHHSPMRLNNILCRIIGF